MGKDQSGVFHPGKGKPSGINKEEGLGMQATEPEKMDQYLELTDNYTAGEDELAPGVPLRHPNRNSSKNEDSFKGKENSKESDKTTVLSMNRELRSPVAEEIGGGITKELFADLSARNATVCISVYLDTSLAGTEEREPNTGFSSIAFKNVLQDLTRQLTARQLTETEIETLLQPGYDLLRDDSFWLGLPKGLAFFISAGYFKYVTLPLAPQNELVCSSSFYLAPLVPIFSAGEYFYLLVISKQAAKLFRGNLFGLEFIPVEGLPANMEEVTGTLERNASTWRTGGRGGTGGANFHGVGGGPDHKTDIARYLEATDDVFYKAIFNKENAPLLLAGVDYLIPIYRSVCDYHNVYEQALTGSYEHQTLPQLHAEAMKAMKPYFDKRKDNALESFAVNISSPLTASMAEAVIPASYYGKVASLFIRKGAHIYGQFDEQNNKIQLHEQQLQDSEDLLERAVEKTLLQGGDVFVLDQEEMPSAGADIAAVFRY